MAGAQWTTSAIRVADLFLDPDNVRLDQAGSGASQDELILDLFVNQGAFDIASSIARHGLFQHELPVVVDEDEKKVVLEGNRRIAALKALANPSLVPTFSSRLESLNRSSKELPITLVDVKMAPSRDAANPLLAAIHTTESRRPWSSLRQAYFYFAQLREKKRTIKQLIQRYPGVDIAKFVRMWEMHGIAAKLTYDSPEEQSAVQNQQTFPISTLERLYDNSLFRQRLGITFTPTGKVKISSDLSSFKAAFKRVIQDIVNGTVTSRTLNRIEQIKEYVSTIPTVANSSSKPVNSSAIKKSRTTHQTGLSKSLAPKDIVCKLPYPAIKRVLLELQKIDYVKLPNASHDLLRSFIECALKAYFDHVGDPVPSKGTFTFLNDVLAHAESHFETKSKSDKALRKYVQVVKVMRQSAGNTTANYLYSKDFLDALNHNHTIFSTGAQVRDAWDQVEPLLRYVLGQ